MVSSRDVQEIIEKLSSDKAKAREDGIKLLNTWLEGERSVRFCKYMSENTSKLKPNAIPHSETWPFLVSLLIQCVSAEISSSKRRLPKPTYSKTLRIVIQRAEDAKYSDKTLPLLPVVKSIYNHVWDVVSNVPSFQSEYGIILRHLLAVRDYRFHLRKRIYSSLLLLYIEKVETGLGGKSNLLSNPKEEVFRSILTLQSLINNPPGDFPGDAREEIVKGFVQIFASVREESKISRKLIECINAYLLKDGPNLGTLSLEIHNALQRFVFQCWLTTHDKGLKDAIIFYARLQLSLTRGVNDGNSLIEQLMDVICRELDQGSLTSGVPWTDSSKDDKPGTLSTSQCGFVELAALVLFKACANTVRAQSVEKRAKREHITVVLKEALVKGKWLWGAAFCCLINNYFGRMNKDLFMCCFEGISTNFERHKCFISWSTPLVSGLGELVADSLICVILADANMQHSYDGLLWTLRSLQELSAVLLLSDSREHISSGSCSLSSNEMGCGWHLVWRCLMQGLPTFSSFTIVVDAAFLLMGNIVSRDLVSACVVPNDIWDLKPFKQVSSKNNGRLTLSNSSLDKVSEGAILIPLFRFSCKIQSDLRESLHLRRNLLRTILGYLNLKDSSTLNEHMVLLLPGAVYSLCAGCVPFALSHRGLFSLTFLDTSETTADGLKADESDLRPGELFECSVDVLARTDSCKLSEGVSPFQFHQSVRLPKELKYPLLNDLETYILEFIEEKQIQKNVSDILYMCALLSNLIYGSLTTRKQEDVSSFVSKMCQYLLELLDDAVILIQEHGVDLQSSLLAAFRSFVSSPIFIRKGGQCVLDILSHDAICQSLERLLKALSKLYVQSSEFPSSNHSEVTGSGILSSDASLQGFDPTSNDGSRIVDMELDLNGDSKEVIVLTAGGKIGSGKCCSTLKWKLGMISLISSFVYVLDLVTWDVLFDLYQNECDTKVREDVLYHLCKHLTLSSSSKIANLVQTMDKMFEMQSGVKLNCINVVIAVDQLLHSLFSLDTVLKNSGQTLKKLEFEPSLIQLGDIVNKFSDVGLLDWVGRVRLVDCICNFVLLNPQISQRMIERLFVLLQDPDYRVRFSLAQRIGVLFQTWDGHEELFQDICSNFGIKLVQPFEGKLVTAKEVLAGDPQPPTRIETTVVTLMHLALHSEKIEAEAVFMMCVISALDPSQRELVITVLNHLSRRLQYPTRFKYLDELIGPVLFCWVSCGVSLVSLLEIRQNFVTDAEPGYFIQYCFHWLLPALILHNDNDNLMWVAKVASQPLGVLLRSNFIPIFSVGMALYCSKKSGWEKASFILQSSILQLAEMSENERDKMIKKHMVAIVNHILSLTSSASDPGIPFFSRETIGCAIQTVVDGFLETDSYPTAAPVVDRINIFRPDRVFMFIVEMHYKIEAAVHQRHKCHRLAGIEVLIEILGRRAAVSSTYSYLLNLIGQFIGCDALQDQCCRLMSALIKTFKDNLSGEVVSVLGEQLQFLVSKLVACCFPSETALETPGSKSFEFSSLLVQLTVESGPSLHDYVRELEAFPDMGMFAGIRKFHQELCQTYSPREHLLKVVKRSCHLPPRLLMSSIQALHKKLLMEEDLLKKRCKEDSIEDVYWHHDPEMTQAVWTLVRMCGSDDADHIRPLVSDFVSRVGIGDPYRVVFHLPGHSAHSKFFRPIISDSASEIIFKMDNGISEELLAALLKLLKKFLMDDSVRIVDIASQTLRGILSTELGQRAISLFDSYERSLIEIHSKGVDIELVEKLLLDKEIRFKTEASLLQDSSLWETLNKTFERWICPLVHSLIGYSNDVILRLCQDIVLLKPEVAELLLPSAIVDLASRKDMDVDLYKLISLKVQENVLTNANKLTKSIQVFLNALNELRLCHVMNRTSIVPSKRESTKYAKPSSSKSHSSSARARDSVIGSNSMAISTSSWDKVYWLTIDYLVVAKSAVTCGSYFTAIMYVEYWCEENFGSLMLGSPDFSHHESLPDHIEILVSAVTQINEPDSLYGIIQSHKLTSQVLTYEHEGNWSKALEYYDLLVRSNSIHQMGGVSRNLLVDCTSPSTNPYFLTKEDDMRLAGPHKGLIRSLQQMGCTNVLDLYCQGFTSRKSQFQHDLEFIELQYEAAWRAGNWDFSLLSMGANSPSHQHVKTNHFNENLHSCLRALQEGDYDEFHKRLKGSKQELVWSVSCASEESTEYIYSAIVKLQILYHLGMAWHIRWTAFCGPKELCMEKKETFPEPVIPTMEQLSWLNTDWNSISERTQLHMNLLEPFIAFRRVLLQILGCSPCTMQHLLHSTAALRKGSRFSQAAATLHELKFLCAGITEQPSSIYLLGRLEEAKLLRAQSQHEMAISLAKYISENCCPNKEASDVHRLVGKWLAETRSSNSTTILEKYLKPAVTLADKHRTNDMKSVKVQSQAHFQLARYADALFRSYEERLTSNEWQAAMRLRKHKTIELEALVKRLRSSVKGEKADYTVKIQELQRQLAMDREEAEKMQDDRDNFLSLALEAYKRCLVIGDKYDMQVVFRLVSLWFSLSSRQNVVVNMQTTIDEVQSYKFVPLVYQIASRLGSSKDGVGPHKFQLALVSLLKKMAKDHPYHTIFQLLALENGDRIKDKQRNRNSFVVDVDKIHAAKKLLQELLSYHGAIIKQMRQMVEIYIKLAELETRREDTNKKITLPREIRSVRQLELVPVVTASLQVDRNCHYSEGSFPHFKGLADSVTVMNGINAPKVVECFDSDGHKYRQLAKSGNDDLRQDAVMEQFFGLVNTFLQNNRDTWQRRLGIRTYKVVPFTPSAGVLEWVNGTLPLGEYLIGSMRNGGAHGRYGRGDWSFLKCREHMSNEKDKRKAFQDVCENFRPVMHHFFLERFLQPADWFEKRLAYSRSVAASSMVGYIVGLGDRHAMNILIDQITAEVVHIDLGVAFEQGLMLKTPERVPFRLTRDVIDGMGVAGVEGVFRRCCEETLSVMRTNKEALLTIIEVFIHDPLYKWALSPLKALQLQKETDDDLEASMEDTQDVYEGNKDAARALLRIKQKLDGYEGGELRSAHGQVQQLIQDAIDPERLCQMFPGWGAWL